MGNKISKNPAAKTTISRMSKQSSAFHRSGVASKGLQDAQVARGVKPHAVKSTEMANATRWTGIFRCAMKTRILEDDIKVGLTGDKYGMCDEEPAPIPSESSDDEDADSRWSEDEGDDENEQEVSSVS